MKPNFRIRDRIQHKSFRVENYTHEAEANAHQDNFIKGDEVKLSS